MYCIIVYCRQMSGLTQRSAWSVLEVSLFVSLFNGGEKSRHLVPETLQTIGATALHGL